MYNMGTITINVNDKTEQKFRKAARLSYGSGKGSLGKAATSALEKWADHEMSNNTAKMMEFLEKGFKMGKLRYTKREELHER